MPKVRRGIKPGYGPALKIMADNADDPWATENDQHGKFLFNTENTEIGYVDEIDRVAYISGLSNGVTRYPSGSNYLTETRSVQSNNTQQVWRYRPGFWNADYMPLVEVRQVTGANKNVFAGPGNWKLANWGVDFAESTVNGGYGWLYSLDYTGQPVFYRYRSYQEVTSRQDGTVESVVSAWSLPADPTPLPAVGTPTPGDKVFRLDPTMFRFAKPGFEYTDSNPKNFILHEDRIPAKVIKAGEIGVAAGAGQTATINTPAAFPLTPNTYMDFHARRDIAGDFHASFFHPPYIYSPNTDDGIGFRYTVNANSVVIENLCKFPIIVRYLILADSDQQPTTGGSKVAYVGEDGGERFWRAKRPGSSDSAPNLNDIMLDTRLAYLPLLKEGFINWPDDFTGVYTGGDRYLGERYIDIDIHNPTGMRLFVKHVQYWPAYTIKPAGNEYYVEPASILPRTNIYVNAGSYSGRWNQMSTSARIYPSEDKVRFAMAGNNWQYINTTSHWRDVPPSGIRYYVFGLPD